MWSALALTAASDWSCRSSLGAVSLRVAGIAFAMVTLAFAQAGAILVSKNPDKLTGGEEGVGLDFEPLPDFFVGVLNTKNLYWHALGYLVGRLRGRVLGDRLLAGPGLAGDPRERAAGRGARTAPVLVQADGVRARLVPRDRRRRRLPAPDRGATPEVTTASFTLTLLLMVVIGGTGTRWGARHRRGPLHVPRQPARSPSRARNAVQDLPGLLRTPLSEPLFVLGTLFILIVFFFPGGIAALGAGGAARGAAPDRARRRPSRAGRGGRMSVAERDGVRLAWEGAGSGPPCC